VVNKHNILFRKLNAASFCVVALVAAWMTLGASIALTALTIAAAGTLALIVGREMDSDVVP
jgi:hypothetical protein